MLEVAIFVAAITQSTLVLQLTEERGDEFTISGSLSSLALLTRELFIDRG